jgi:hypothetical protein
LNIRLLREGKREENAGQINAGIQSREVEIKRKREIQRQREKSTYMTRERTIQAERKREKNRQID